MKLLTIKIDRVVWVLCSVFVLSAPTFVIVHKIATKNQLSAESEMIAPKDESDGISESLQPIDQESPQQKIYSNKDYGFSYQYPSYWEPGEEVKADPENSATRQEFGVSLKMSGLDSIYTNVLRVEVLDEPLGLAQAWYDKYYSQTTLKVQANTTSIQGRESVQYDSSHQVMRANNI